MNVCPLILKMNFDKMLQKRGVLDVKTHIEDNYGGVITSNEAVRILYQLCKIVTKNEGACGAKSLFELIVLCSKNVNNLKEAEVNPFLMSIYHFVKYFFKHVSLIFTSFFMN